MDALKDVFQRLEASIRETGTDLPGLIGELEKIKALAWGQMVRADAPQPTPLPDQSRYLTVEQVCDRFHVTAKWLYRHKKKLPHSQPSRKVLLFPEGRLCQWFERRQTA